MEDYVFWFVIGFGLVIAELLTGTFYLLVIAVAFGAAGLVALLGASTIWQLITAAVADQLRLIVNVRDTASA